MTKTIGLQTLSHQLNQVVGDVISEGQTDMKQPALIMSPKLANPAQAVDFELKVILEDSSHA
ncbi:MAG: hypothetical protein ETSY1_13375 [Candidatus Entotheonella factor]|uniref:Uncharacterized protein n=1 Tax=Entotheonella factor TaxID=1429438 RepID=W4LPU6_ENTF1|nr:hypothetical protein [Candidatus Entotheonella palauensis]ETW99864.1 MAG: hypothetical protein ETSY1_13375 [Candidatus Entotheonella factor]